MARRFLRLTARFLGRRPDAGVCRKSRRRRADLTWPASRRLTALKPDVPLAGEVALSPDGLTVVGNGGANVLHSWDVRTRQDRFAMPDSHTDSVTSMVFSPDGKTLITAGSDHTVRLWDLNSGRQLRVLKCGWHPEGLALSPDGRWLVAPTDYDGKVFIWDLKNDASQKVFTALSSTPGLGQPGAVRILEDNNSVLLAIPGGRLMRWDIKEWRSQDMPHPQLSSPDLSEGFRDFHIRQAVFLSGGKRLAALIFLGGLRVVDTPRGRNGFDQNSGISWSLQPMSKCWPSPGRRRGPARSRGSAEE